MGDWNMSINQIRTLEGNGDIETVTRMNTYPFDYTFRRSVRSMSQTHIDHIFTDLHLTNVMKIKEPNEKYGSDHACIIGDFTADDEEIMSEVPSR
jgi:endonuclease/exonuclease/phosphatase (EEP) superfamily protein YafD